MQNKKVKYKFVSVPEHALNSEKNTENPYQQMRLKS